MVHWEQIVTSIVLMLGMCFAGMIFGGIVHFLYKKFTKTPATDSLELIFFHLGCLKWFDFSAVELSDIGVPDLFFGRGSSCIYLGDLGCRRLLYDFHSDAGAYAHCLGIRPIESGIKNP